MEIYAIEKKHFDELLSKVDTLLAELGNLNKTEKEVFSLKEAAEYLCISQTVLSVKASKGEIKGYKNGIWRFLKSDLMAYIKAS